MDVREKLVEMIFDSINLNMHTHRACNLAAAVADDLISHGVTVQEWISVKDELPKYTDEYNVTVGEPSEFGYFEKVTTLRFERIKGKEPRWVIPNNEIYKVIAWMPLPNRQEKK